MESSLDSGLWPRMADSVRRGTFSRVDFVSGCIGVGPRWVVLPTGSGRSAGEAVWSNPALALWALWVGCAMDCLSAKVSEAGVDGGVIGLWPSAEVA